MSHYVVYVVSDELDDVEALLDPYNENDHHTEHEENGDESYSYNPNARWDWYEIGGRWKDDLILYDGSKADYAQVKDIDWHEKVAAEFKRQQEYWDKRYNIIKDLPKFKLWKQVRDEFTDIDEARRYFNNQPAIKALINANFFFLYDEFLGDLQTGDKNSCCMKYAMSNVIPYAILNEEDWHEPGRMGWFGMSTAGDEETEAFKEWAWEYLTNLDGNKYITVVDCHC